MDHSVGYVIWEDDGEKVEDFWKSFGMCGPTKIITRENHF